MGMGIVFIYAVLGGMKGITYTQIAQYCVLIFAYTIPAIFISLQLTGNPIPQLGLGSTMADGSGVYLLDKLDLIVTDLGFREYTTSSNGNMLNMFLYTLSLMIGTAGLPHVIIRFFTVPKVRDARASAGWALVFIAILYTTAPAVGAMARLNLINTIQTGPVGSPTGNVLISELPDWMGRWQATGLLNWEDKNGDGRIQFYDEAGMGDKAAAYGWAGNEMTKVDSDIMVLANPEIAGLPNWVVALVAAGGIAAALSTAAGLLLAISSAISHDLAQGRVHEGYFREERADGRSYRHGRRDRRGGVPGSESTRLCGTGGGFGLRSGGLVDLPCPYDGYLRQARQQQRRRGWYVDRSGLNLAVHLLVQGMVLHSWHRDGGQ